jgi:hypothetical protein
MTNRLLYPPTSSQTFAKFSPESNLIPPRCEDWTDALPAAQTTNKILCLAKSLVKKYLQRLRDQHTQLLSYHRLSRSWTAVLHHHEHWQDDIKLQLRWTKVVNILCQSKSCSQPVSFLVENQSAFVPPYFKREETIFQIDTQFLPLVGSYRVNPNLRKPLELSSSSACLRI